ncbi:leucine--tRNA ligase [Nonlabens spongiae]|uniref:leucine--tRNA ligase n=1 Tax=Nonlabens spongiae TaxID=331648 RepID=UPI001FE6BBBF|nr:DUF559 domain-containing protein [Nonlabens spongiae]
MLLYDHKEIEKKWQKFWAENKTFKAHNHSDKPKFYALDMFPYPSGAGLHVGHPLGYIASDIVSRFKRHTGHNVLHPMGYDSFGLPAEQYAIQTGQHPAITTRDNIARYREQMDRIGFSFDWDREVKTSDPDYYKFTQEIFIQLFESWYDKDADRALPISELVSRFRESGTTTINAATDDDLRQFTAEEWNAMTEVEQERILLDYRLTYLADTEVNWCPALGTVLANDEIVNGVSERGGHPVERKKMRQWMMRISAYAERLLNGLEDLDWSESIKEIQRNWIGKSVGAMVHFELNPNSEQNDRWLSGAEAERPKISVFTTRPDTIYGVTFMTLAPEHELVDQITTDAQREAVEAYKKATAARSERERMADVKTISGVFTGAYATHPLSGEQIPVWIGDYVLAGYGTGAVMAVPCGDERDHAFANYFSGQEGMLPIKNIFKDVDVSEEAYASKENITITNSDFLDGMSYKEAMAAAIAKLEEVGAGKGKTNYRLRDAVFSRQRYWGEPFPVYYMDGLPQMIDRQHLPLELPEVDEYLPTEDGAPPLGRAKKWYWDARENKVVDNPEDLTPSPSPAERGAHQQPMVDDDETPSPSERAGERYNHAIPELQSKHTLQARQNRKSPTAAEDKLWQELRNRKLADHKFRRQHPIDRFIVDFVCLDRRLIIEVDGEIHENQKEEDEARTNMLELEKGFKMIRFSNYQVLNDTETVLSEIKKTLSQRPSLKNMDSNSLSAGEGWGEVAEIYPLELNTMPGWAGSSWYMFRYMDASNDSEMFSKEAQEYWQNVDLYIGGSEHATGHLLYSRFWVKFLKDIGKVTVDEPFKKLINQGMILGESAFVKELEIEIEDQTESVFISQGIKYNGKIKSGRKLHTDVSFVNNSNELDVKAFQTWRVDAQDKKFILNEEGVFKVSREVEKMSKSKYNVVNPDDICDQYGADTLRLYEMFLGPLEQAKPWNTAGITGVYGFIKKLWKLYHNENGFNVSDKKASPESMKTLHKTIKKIREDIENFSFNTSVSSFMIAVNKFTAQKCNHREVLEPLAVLVSPYAPHIAEELWSLLGHEESIAYAEFPVFEVKYLVESSKTYPISFNGKMKFTLDLPVDVSKDELEKLVLENEKVQEQLEGKTIRKTIVVPGKIVNFVVG